tara:strand:- start:997 stop:1137 length:141 start_codon:yes stop_codon:yes gene_type:complete
MSRFNVRKKAKTAAMIVVAVPFVAAAAGVLVMLKLVYGREDVIRYY